LSAQLDVVERGVDADSLCPPSPLGAVTVVVYPRNSMRSAAMWSDTPRTNQDGWSTVTYRCTVPSARSITVALGAEGGVVEVGLLRVELQYGGVTSELLIDRADHDALGLVLGRRLGRFTIGFAPGGHLRLDLPSAPGEHSCVVRLSIAYRGIGATGVDPRLVGPSRIRTAPQRLWIALKQRLRGPARRTVDAFRSLRARVRG